MYNLHTVGEMGSERLAGHPFGAHWSEHWEKLGEPGGGSGYIPREGSNTREGKGSHGRVRHLESAEGETGHAPREVIKRHRQRELPRQAAPRQHGQRLWAGGRAGGQ